MTKQKRIFKLLFFIGCMLLPLVNYATHDKFQLSMPAVGLSQSNTRAQRPLPACFDRLSMTRFFLSILSFPLSEAPDFMSQQDTSVIHLPMKNGKITYEQTYPTNKSKDEVFALAEKWFGQTFPDEPQQLYTADKKSGQIKGIGMFKVITSSSGNYYWLKFDVNISVTDGSCSITTGNYFEKPIEKGISNEYSKISYRWWDYRRGHPWSVEDKALFAGLNQHTLQIIASLKQSINP